MSPDQEEATGEPVEPPPVEPAEGEDEGGAE